jgi:hypothetical protein
MRSLFYTYFKHIIVYTMSLLTLVCGPQVTDQPPSRTCPPNKRDFRKVIPACPQEATTKFGHKDKPPPPHCRKGPAGPAGMPGGGGHPPGGLRGSQDVSVVMRSSVWFVTHFRKHPCRQLPASGAEPSILNSKPSTLKPATTL